MTTEVLTFNLIGGAQQTGGQGRVWYIKTATAALTITLETSRSGASVRKFINVGAGFKYTAKDTERWSMMRILSAVNQVVEIVIGDDDVEVANAVTVSGGVAVSVTPSSTLADTAALVTVVTAGAVLVAVNPARRRVTISNDPASANTVYIKKTGGANRLAFVQPGTFIEVDTTSGLDYQDAVGGNTLYILEET